MRDLSSSTIHLGPKEGRAVHMPEAQLITRKVGSEHTGGAYSLFEVAVGPMGGSEPHIQHKEDECFYVLEGQFEFLIEGATIEAGPGSLIYVPKGTLHAHKNLGESVGRAQRGLEIDSRGASSVGGAINSFDLWRFASEPESEATPHLGTS